ncbi:MAG: RidA family protein [Patescibacteria group bacterium]
MKQIIQTNKAPQAIGPYSQAVIANGFIFCSGQISLQPDGTLVNGSIEEQTKQVMENLKEILEAGGSDFEKVVKTTIYLIDLNDFVAVNEIYSSYFKNNYPARATAGVNSLPKGAEVEIEMVALA